MSNHIDNDLQAIELLRSIDSRYLEIPSYVYSCNCDDCRDFKAGFQENLELVKSMIQSPQSAMPPEELAELLHDTGARLAPQYGYEPAPTWAELSSTNQALMTAIVEHTLKRLSIRPAVSLSNRPTGLRCVNLAGKRSITVFLANLSFFVVVTPFGLLSIM